MRLILTDATVADAVGTTLCGNPTQTFALEFVIADTLHAAYVPHRDTALGIGKLDHFEETEKAFSLRFGRTWVLQYEICLNW